MPLLAGQAMAMLRTWSLAMKVKQAWHANFAWMALTGKATVLSELIFCTRAFVKAVFLLLVRFANPLESAAGRRQWAFLQLHWLCSTLLGFGIFLCSLPRAFCYIWKAHLMLVSVKEYANVLLIQSIFCFFVNSSRCSFPRLKVILKCPRGSVRQMPVHGKHHYTSRHPFLYPSVALEVSWDVAILVIFEDLYCLYVAMCFFWWVDDLHYLCVRFVSLGLSNWQTKTNMVIRGLFARAEGGAGCSRAKLTSTEDAIRSRSHVIMHLIAHWTCPWPGLQVMFCSPFWIVSVDLQYSVQ